MLNRVIIFFFLLSATANLAAQPASEVLAKAIKANKVIVIGIGQELDDEQLELLISKYNIEEIIKDNYINIAISQFVNKGSASVPSSITVKSGNGRETIFTEFIEDHNPVQKDLPEKIFGMKPILTATDLEEKPLKYLMALDDKVPLAGTASSATCYPIMDQLAAYLIDSDESEDPGLTNVQLAEFLYVYDLYKSGKLKADSVKNVSSEFAKNLITNLSGFTATKTPAPTATVKSTATSISPTLVPTSVARATATFKATETPHIQPRTPTPAPTATPTANVQSTLVAGGESYIAKLKASQSLKAYWPIAEDSTNGLEAKVGGRNLMTVDTVIGKIADGYKPGSRAFRTNRYSCMYYAPVSQFDQARILPRYPTKEEYIPLFSNKESFILTAWIKTGYPGPNGSIMSYVAPKAKVLFMLKNGRLFAELGKPGATMKIQSSKKVNDQKWHQVALEVDSGGNAVRLVIDGAVDTASTNPGGCGKIAKGVLNIKSCSKQFYDGTNFRTFGIGANSNDECKSAFLGDGVPQKYYSGYSYIDDPMIFSIINSSALAR